MATERVNKPPSLPEYPQIIFEAIDALNQKEGSNKSSISKYIESKYGELPDAHSNLLTFHLDRMRQSGDLIFLKNNYLRPGPDAPPKRGRGRPPKPKAPGQPERQPEAVLAPPRPRGRPRKDPNAPPNPKKARPAPSPSGRPRGRPRKVKPAHNNGEGI